MSFSVKSLLSYCLIKTGLFVMFVGPVLLISCRETGTPDNSTTHQVPQAAFDLHHTVNLRANLLEMRGLTSDFTANSWRAAGLHTVQPQRDDGSYFLLGRFPGTPEGVTSLLILEDRPEESSAWVVNYYQGRIQDELLVFYRNDRQDRRVNSDWRNNLLTVNLQNRDDRYQETFIIDRSGSFVPYREEEAPQ